jgi:putative ABC transport system substrate-binding protein
LLSEIAPGLKRAAIMFNPDTFAASAYMPSLETAAAALKVVPIPAPVHSDLEIETAIIALGREPGDGLVVMPDIFNFVHRAPIISAAARANVPAVYASHQSVNDGGLLSYARGVSRVGRCSLPLASPSNPPARTIRAAAKSDDDEFRRRLGTLRKGEC